MKQILLIFLISVNGCIIANDNNTVIDLYNFNFGSLHCRGKTTNKAFFENTYYHWWQLLLGDESNYHYNKIDSLYRLSKKNYTNKFQSKASIDTFYFMAVASFKLRAEVVKQHKGRSVSQMLNVLDDVKKVMGNYERSEYYALFSGLFMVAFYELKEKYGFYYMLFSFLLPEGDKEKGIKLLEECMYSKDKIVSTEACYFLFKVYKNIDSDNKRAFKYIRKLHELYPGNLIYLVEYYETLKDIKGTTVLKSDIVSKIENASSIMSFQKEHLISRVNSIKINNKDS